MNSQKTVRAQMDTILTWVATLGPIGRIPRLGPLPAMPGTWGSLAATLAAPLLFLPLPTMGRLGLVLAILGLGILACSRAETVLGAKDPGQVVVDELFGQWLALMPLAAGAPWWQLALAFALFRSFDIAKPWPVRQLERRLEGGLGVMLDDGAAGLMAGLLVWLVLWLVAGLA